MYSVVCVVCGVDWHFVEEERARWPVDLHWLAGAL